MLAIELITDKRNRMGYGILAFSDAISSKFFPEKTYSFSPLHPTHLKQ